MKKIKAFILSIWNKFSDESKVRIISILNTAGSTFLVTVAITLVNGEIIWSISFFVGVLSAGVREALKAVTATFIPKRLGGRK